MKFDKIYEHFMSTLLTEDKEDIVERIETIKKGSNQEPPEESWDPNKLLEVLESTTYNIAENRVKRNLEIGLDLEC